MLEKHKLRFSPSVLKFLCRIHADDNTTRTIAFKDQRLNHSTGKLAKMNTKSSTKTKTIAKATKAPAKKTSKIVEELRTSSTPTTPYKINLERGETDWSVSDQWARRANDERFASYPELRTHIREKHGRAKELTLKADRLRVTDKSTSRLLLMHEGQTMSPTNAAFTQLCQALKMPPSFIQECSAESAGMLLNEFMKKRSIDGELKALAYPNHTTGELSLEAITPTTYQRIWNADVLKAIDYLLHLMPSFKVPGELDWGSMKHNPNVDTTKDNTTLFAGERDMFVFMCDDLNPIECGKTSQGDTDVYFPFFKFVNSETGFGCLEGSSGYLRGVCFNRSLRGVEGVKSFKLRHTKNVIESFENASATLAKSLHSAEPKTFADLIQRARTLQIASNKEECVDFLQKRTFSKRTADAIIDATVQEEGEEPRTAFLMSAGITAYARSVEFQDRRNDLELTATKILELAA